MNRPVAGIDVGVRRLDCVVLVTGGTAVRDHVALAPDALGAWLADVRPAGIGVDAPCSWAAAGRSRAAERALLRAGMHCYATPTEDVAVAPFYDWVRVGLRAFAACRAAGYALYDGRGAPRPPFVMETFPHGVEVALVGPARPRVTGAARRARRRAALVAAGVDDAGLRGVDAVDAALAAVAVREAMAGRAVAYGDPEEGVVVLPRPAPPAA